jgi:hypothetical protein
MLKTLSTSAIALFFSFISTAQTNVFLPAKTKTTVTLKTPAGVAAQSNLINSGKIIVDVDTSIRVAPAYAYLSIDFTGITGTSSIEILNGTNLVWIIDKAGKEVLVKERFLKKVNGAMENNIVNMTVKIPYRLKTDKNIYTIHYRWESKDKTKNLDVLTSK